MSDRPNVAILVQTATAWGRDVVEGIAEYVQEHGPWLIFVEPRGLHERLSVPARWRGDGIIARVDHPELAEQIASLGVPAVNVAWSSVDPSIVPSVRVDDDRCGALAAEHLIDCGLRAFGYVGQSPRTGYMNERLFDAFAARASRAGGAVRRYVEPDIAGRPMPWRDSLEHLAAWLRGFGRPIGVFVFGDAEARLVVQACALAGLRVPEDVAIVGSEQDPLMSALCGMGISAINHHPQSVGYKAAEMLHAMMQGRTLESRLLKVPPTGVVGRESTDGTAVSDPLVRDALVFIRDHIREPIRVRDLARHLGVARRTLESRFRAAIERSPGEAIRRLRVERAARLLSDTPMPLARVAELCGYAEPRLLTAHFRQVHGMTPTAYRRERREAAARSAAEEASSLTIETRVEAPMPPRAAAPPVGSGMPGPDPTLPARAADRAEGGIPEVETGLQRAKARKARPRAASPMPSPTPPQPPED